MITAHYSKYLLNFKRPSGTSRGVLKTKETFFIYLKDTVRQGIGECAVFRGLSSDDLPDYEEKLAWTCAHIYLGKEQLLQKLQAYPSLQFGLEQAFLSLNAPTPFELYSTGFVKKKQPIAINGLIWMGDTEFMKAQIEEKLEQGFATLKMKIGALDFEKECALLSSIRKRFSADQITLRVDANGAFSPSDALEKLKRLAAYDLHSIEQPIRQGQPEAMAALCKNTSLPIALDEELIGVFSKDKKEQLLQEIQPQYIILKPSLLGGIQGSEEWISIAEKHQIAWWVTSALESNIGLNAIAQWTSTLNDQTASRFGYRKPVYKQFRCSFACRAGSFALQFSKRMGFRNDQKRIELLKVTNGFFTKCLQRKNKLVALPLDTFNSFYCQSNRQFSAALGGFDGGGF